MALFPFANYPHRGHPAHVWDSYDLCNKKGSLRIFRWFLYIIVFFLIILYFFTSSRYFLGTYENFFHKNYYISDARYYLFWVMESYGRSVQHGLNFALPKLETGYAKAITPVEEGFTFYLDIIHRVYMSGIDCENSEYLFFESPQAPVFYENSTSKVALVNVLHQQVFFKFPEIEYISFTEETLNLDIPAVFDEVVDFSEISVNVDDGDDLSWLDEGVTVDASNN